MTMRATVQRDMATTDAYGQPGPSDWLTLGDVACFAWQGGGRRSSATPRVIEADDVGMLVPAGTDITSADRISHVYDRRGRDVFALPMYVDAVILRADHLEVRLREHR